MGDFARTIGVEDHHIGSLTQWIDAGGPDAAPAPQSQATEPPPATAPVVAAAPPQPNDAQRRAEIESMMRTDGGRGYWKSEPLQQEYREILGRAEAATAATPAAVPGQAPAGGQSNESVTET
jgi:hypothetical protein